MYYEVSTIRFFWFLRGVIVLCYIYSVYFVYRFFCGAGAGGGVSCASYTVVEWNLELFQLPFKTTRDSSNSFGPVKVSQHRTYQSELRVQ